MEISTRRKIARGCWAALLAATPVFAQPTPRSGSAPQATGTQATSATPVLPLNIATNGDFETSDDALQPADWSPGLAPDDDAGFQRRQAVQYVEEDNNNHFVLLHAVGAGNTRKIARSVVLLPTWRTLKVSARVRSKDLKEGANPWEDAHIGIVYYDAKNKELGFDKAVAPVANLEWTTMGRVLRVPFGTHHVIIDAGNFGTAGEFAIDDLRVEPNGVIDAPLLHKASFDGTFEILDKQGQPLGWPIKGRKGISVVEENGNRFLRLENPVRDNEVGVDAFWKLDPTVRELRFRARVRGRNIKPGPHPPDTARLDIVFTNEYGLPVRQLLFLELKASSNWKTRELIVPIIAPYKLVRLSAILFYAGGTLDIDDIEIEPVQRIVKPKKAP
jgi:hypothetical protein